MSEKKKTRSIVLEGFGGVDHTESHNGIFSARNIENFRILNDGSLEKRQCYRPLAHLGEPVRAVYGCNVSGEYKLFVLVADTVYTVDSKGQVSAPIGSIETSEGSACFFFFRKTLYLIDGVSFYEHTGDGFVHVSGYAPLVAKDWENSILGEINEPRNIITRHARATYLISDTPTIFMCVGEPIESVEAVYINNTIMPEKVYSINDQFNTINVTGLNAGDRVEIHFTYKYGYDELFKRLCSSTASALFGGIGSNRLFLCGGSGSGTVFCTKNVSSLELAESRKHYPESGSLYFPLTYEFEAGDGIAQVRAIVRQYEHIVIFTENDVWMVTPDEDGRDIASTTSVNGSIGCPASMGAALAENEPVSIGYRSIFSWAAGSSSKCDAVNISRQIDSELGEDFLRSCGIFYYVTRNEIWVYSKVLPIIWVYNTIRKAWYKFTGIRAETVLDLNGTAAFITDGELYLFDDSCQTDTDLIGGVAVSRTVTAIYSTNRSDLGVFGNKNLSSMTLSADLGEEELLVDIELYPDRAKEYAVYSSEGSDHSDIYLRCPAERFDNASVSITAHGLERPKIHRLTLEMR